MVLECFKPLFNPSLFGVLPPPLGFSIFGILWEGKILTRFPSGSSFLLAIFDFLRTIWINMASVGLLMDRIIFLKWINELNAAFICFWLRKGLQGFARLCPGDVFEITLRHGNQKWRTKGKIGRDGSQTWDSPKFTFKVMIDELLFIRAVEVRSLGKQVCRRLFLVSVSVSGSVGVSVSVADSVFSFLIWFDVAGDASISDGAAKRKTDSSPDELIAPRVIGLWSEGTGGIPPVILLPFDWSR